MQRYIVKNNSGTVFNLKQNKIMFKPNQMVDMVNRTGKTIVEIENDVEIMREIGYKNLLVIERFDPNDRNDELVRKMDNLLERLQCEKKEPIPEPVKELVKEIIQEPVKEEIKISNINLEDIKKVVDECLKSVLKSGNFVQSGNKTINNDDEKLRELAIEQLLKRAAPVEKNLNLGVDREVEHEDHSDDIDF